MWKWSLITRPYSRPHLWRNFGFMFAMFSAKQARDKALFPSGASENQWKIYIQQVDCTTSAGYVNAQL